MGAAGRCGATGGGGGGGGEAVACAAAATSGGVPAGGSAAAASATCTAAGSTDWNQTCAQRAQRTLRPSGRNFSKGATKRVPHSGQPTIIFSDTVHLPRGPSRARIVPDRTRHRENTSPGMMQTGDGRIDTFARGCDRKRALRPCAPSSSDGRAVIHFENAGYRYGRGAEVLRGLGVEIPAGAFVVVTGESGAGKSSLLRLLYLDAVPTAGRLTLFGRDVAGLSRDEVAWFRRRIGVVFQDFRLLDHLTAAENVALPLRVAGAREASYRDNVAEMLDWVGLGDRMNVRPPALSGGEKQRVAIARAVVASPDLILADEPTGSVDPVRAERIVQLLVEMNRMGKTVVVATHAPERMPADASLLELRDGALVAAAAAATAPAPVMASA